MLVVVGLLLAACGGGDSKENGPTSGGERAGAGAAIGRRGQGVRDAAADRQRPAGRHQEGDHPLHARAPGDVQPHAGACSSARLDAVVDQLRGELDPAKGQALSLQAQEIERADAANAYLVGAPVVYLHKNGKVQGFVPHPDDAYFIDREMSVR